MMDPRPPLCHEGQQAPSQPMVMPPMMPDMGANPAGPIMGLQIHHPQPQPQQQQPHLLQPQQQPQAQQQQQQQLYPSTSSSAMAQVAPSSSSPTPFVSKAPPPDASARLSSFPHLHYLEESTLSTSCPPDVLLVPRDRVPVASHRALLGASFSRLHEALLHASCGCGGAEEAHVTALFPEFTHQQLQSLVRAALGDCNLAEADPEVRQLMKDLGYMEAQFAPPGSIAGIKTETVIPNEDDEKENKVLLPPGKEEGDDGDHNGDESFYSSDEEYIPPKRKRARRAKKPLPGELADFLDDGDEWSAERGGGGGGSSSSAKGEAEFDAEAGQCSQCRDDFTTEDDFNSHLPCAKAKKVFCEDCGALLNKYSLYNHRKHCQGAREQYECLECGDGSSTSLKQLDDHNMKVHNRHAQVSCRFCSAVYHWGGIGRHLGMCESNPNRAFDADGNPLSARNRKRRGRPRTGAAAAGAGGDDVLTNKALPLDNGLGYRCLAKDCAATADTKKAILKHYKAQHEASSHKCEHCGERFAGKRDYQAHLKNVHDVLDDSRVMCDKCGFDVCKSGLRKHMDKCDGTMSSTARLFKKHDFKPHPEDPTRCPEPECDFRHDSLGQVRLHYRKRHVKVSCEHCNTKVSIYFYEEHLTKIHQLVSTAKKTNLSCDECNLKFCFKSHLIEHMERVHIREPKYVCDICGAAHFSKRLLIQHRYETHIRSRKNMCEVCGVVMRSVKPLVQHLKDVHGVKVPKDYKPPGSTKQ